MYGIAYMSEKTSRINHPHHYTQGDIECIQAIEAALGTEGALAYCRGAAIKYLWRCLYKKSPQKDLQKAEWYCKRAQMYVGEAPTSSEMTEIPKGRSPTNKERWELAAKGGLSTWTDTSGRVRSTSNKPEGDE